MPDPSKNTSDMSQSGLLTEEATLRVSEDNLVAAAKCGDVEAFGALFERHKDAVHGFVLRSVGRREDAEDIVQETFRRAWTAIPRFRGQSSLLTWLCRIAANLYIDHARSRKRRVDLASDMDLDPDELRSYSGQGADVETEVINKCRVEAALESLSATHRMLVVLCDIQGLSGAEAAEVMNCSLMSVRARLFQARRKLRVALADVVEEVN